jgi:ferritin-like metal-binding protein YciE
MNIDTFRQMYVSELQELYSVETQLTEALPKMQFSGANQQIFHVTPFGYLDSKPG